MSKPDWAPDGVPDDEDLPVIKVDLTAYGACMICGAARGSKFWRDGDTYRMDGICSGDESHDGW